MPCQALPGVPGLALHSAVSSWLAHGPPHSHALSRSLLLQLSSTSQRPPPPPSPAALCCSAPSLELHLHAHSLSHSFAIVTPLSIVLPQHSHDIPKSLHSFVYIRSVCTKQPSPQPKSRAPSDARHIHTNPAPAILHETRDIWTPPVHFDIHAVREEACVSSVGLEELFASAPEPQQYRAGALYQPAFTDDISLP